MYYIYVYKGCVYSSKEVLQKMWELIQSISFQITKVATYFSRHMWLFVLHRCGYCSNSKMYLSHVLNHNPKKLHILEPIIKSNWLKCAKLNDHCIQIYKSFSMRRKYLCLLLLCSIEYWHNFILHTSASYSCNKH